MENWFTLLGRGSQDSARYGVVRSTSTAVGRAMAVALIVCLRVSRAGWLRVECHRKPWLELTQMFPREERSEPIQKAPAPGLRDPLRLLLVEEDPQISSILVQRFRQQGYEVELRSGSVALQTDPAPYAAIVMDAQLASGDSLQLLERFRFRTSSPILVLCSAGDIAGCLRSFQRGAADVIAKPVCFEELVARIDARRRRVGESSSALTLSAEGPAELDRISRTLVIGGAIVPVTATEMSILICLVDQHGRAVSRDELANAVLSDPGFDKRTLDSHVARLRRKMGPAAKHLRTVWGVGYRFESELGLLGKKQS